MKHFILGIVLGSVLTGTFVGAARFYDSKGNVSAPNGSVQQFDYFRQRQLFIDQNHIRQGIDALKANPCGR
jgi:hypothetical protein